MKAQFVFALLTIVFATHPASADDSAPLPPDLDAVPANALGFVHIRVADVWKSDALKELRETVMKAGDKALAGFDKRFLPAPSSIERLTVVLVPQDAELKRKPAFFAILSVNKPFKQNEFLKSAMPGAVETKTANGSYWVSDKSETAVSFVKDWMIVFGSIAGVQQFVEKPSRGPGALTEALHTANTTRHITLAANLSLIPAKAKNDVPPPAQPLLLAKTAVMSLDLKENSQFDVKLIFSDEKEAAAGLEAIGNLAKTGRDFVKKGREEMLSTVLGDGKVAPLEKLPECAMALVSLGGMDRLDAFLADLPLKRDRNSVKLSMVIPNMSYAAMAPIAMGMLLPAVQKVREAAARMTSVNNLKQIGLAMHNYHDVNGTLPPVVICDKNGKPLLSWRVAILPYIEQNNVYEQFKLDEPWDSEHNKKLIPLMPKTYMDPRVLAAVPGLTNYRVFYGKDTALDLRKSLSLVNITDGTSNTMLAFESADGVTWTKPEDFAYDKKKPLPKFFPGPGGFPVLFCDGSVRLLPETIPEKTLRLIIEANDGQPVEIP